MAGQQVAYQWEARTRAGETKKGVMEADSEAAVENRLKLQLLQVVSVKKQPKQLSLSIGTGVKTTDIVIFTRLFATMIDAGLPIVQCLDILASQAENKRFGKILMSVYMEKSMKLKRRVKGAMTYPISVLGIAGIVVTILLTKVVPVFEKMFKDF